MNCQKNDVAVLFLTGVCSSISLPLFLLASSQYLKNATRRKLSILLASVSLVILCAFVSVAILQPLVVTKPFYCFVIFAAQASTFFTSVAAAHRYSNILTEKTRKITNTLSTAYFGIVAIFLIATQVWYLANQTVYIHKSSDCDLILVMIPIGHAVGGFYSMYVNNKGRTPDRRTKAIGRVQAAIALFITLLWLSFFALSIWSENKFLSLIFRIALLVSENGVECISATIVAWIVPV